MREFIDHRPRIALDCDAVAVGFGRRGGLVERSRPDSTQTASNSASLSFTGLGSAYNTLLLDCNGLQPVTNGVDLELQYGEGATPTWETSNYAYVSGGPSSGGNAAYIYSNSASAIYLNYANGNDVNTATQEEVVKVWIHNVGQAGIYKTSLGQSDDCDSSTYQANAEVIDGKYTGDTNPITAIRILYSSGNISAGQCSLYGLNHLGRKPPPSFSRPPSVGCHKGAYATYLEGSGKQRRSGVMCNLLAVLFLERSGFSSTHGLWR